MGICKVIQNCIRIHHNFVFFSILLCQNTVHNSDVPPFPINNASLKIYTVIDLIDISAVDEHNFFYTMALQMTLSWPDYRLSLIGNDK